LVRSLCWKATIPIIKHNSTKFIIALFGIWALLYATFTLTRPPLLDDADSVHAEVAREMMVRHDWVTLYANGIRYMEKAPLLYWSTAASFKLFGVAEWSARLPLALYTLALILAVFVLGRRLFGSDAAGFYSALMLLTSFGVFIFTRLLIPDVIVCLWMTLAMLFFWRSLEQGEQPSRTTAIGFAVACALNVLTKGLIGVVFPLAVVVIFLLLTRNLRHLARWHPILGALVFLVIAAPWHIAAALANPSQGHPVGLMPTQGNVHGWLWFYFVNEQVLRYLNLRVPHDYDTVPLWLFWGLLLVWMMPWWAFALQALRAIPVRKAARREELDLVERRSLFLALWGLVVLVFFSFSTRQEYYILPTLPAVALLIGGWMAEDEHAEKNGEATPAGSRIAVMLFTTGVVCAIVAAFLAFHGQPPPPGTDLVSLLQQNPGGYALSFGHFLDLTARAMGAFRLPLLMTAAAVLVGTAGNLFFRLRSHPRLANCFLAGMMVAFLAASHIALIIFSPVLSSQILAEAIRPELQEADLVVINGEYESGSTLGFYLQRQIHILNGRSSNLWYGSFFSDAPAIFEDNASIVRLWAGPQRVFLWTEPDKVPALGGRSYIVGRSGGKEILSNQSNDGGAVF
jgi:4-amino-4-deoxy-L-arabinose transferase-like glycosyltransferase